jgi:hypothetical protein
MEYNVVYIRYGVVQLDITIRISDSSVIAWKGFGAIWGLSDLLRSKMPYSVDKVDLLDVQEGIWVRVI